MEIGAIVVSLAREDLIFSDKICYRWTVNKQDGYFSYSELVTKNFGSTYGCDSAGRIYPKTARTVNYAHLVSVLKSKDEQVFKDNAWLWDGEFRLLDRKLNLLAEKNHVCFTSFPRSGNSFLRKFIEQVSGISTGSTMPLHTASSLQIMGMKGEGYTDDTTWIVKAHHPMYVQFSSSFTSNKVFMCVRNPLDVFPSQAAFYNTMSHGNKPDFEIHTEFPEWWAWFVKTQTQIMKRYFEIIRKDCYIDGKNPLYIVRYEDLVLEPKNTLMGLFSFLLNEGDLSGSNVERRID